MGASDQYFLHAADYVVIVAVFIVSTSIGLGCAWKGRSSNSRELFFVGNREMSWFPIAISLMVSYQSSIMMLGTPAEVYIYGASFILQGMGLFVTAFLAGLITPALFRPLRVTSAFEYLERRFQSRLVRLIGVVLALLSSTIYMGVVLFGPAVALESVSNINQWYSIITLCACAVIFTSLGGIKSVVWCDVFQAVVMFTGIFAVIIKATMETGGTQKVWEYAYEGKRLGGFSFNPDPTIRHTVWTQFIPSMIRNIMIAFQQSSVQRVCTAKTHNGAKRLMFLSACLSLLSFILVTYEGIVLYSYFSVQDVEPLSCGLITNYNQIVPFAVVKLLREIPGMPGLILAALFSASLSTISSGYSSMSILVMEDVMGPLLRNTSEARATLYAKIAVVIVGLFSCIVCFVVTFIEGPLTQIFVSLMSCSGGPLSGLFVAAIFFPSLERWGVTVGCICGFIFSSILVFGQNFARGVKKTPWLPLGNSTCPNSRYIVNAASLNETAYGIHNDDNGHEAFPFFNLSYVLNGMIGTLVTLLVALIVSSIVGRNKPGDVDSRYFLEISDTYLIWLPPPIRRWLKRQGPQFKAGWTKRMEGESDNKIKPEEIEMCISPKA